MTDHEDFLRDHVQIISVTMPPVRKREDMKRLTTDEYSALASAVALWGAEYDDERPEEADSMDRAWKKIQDHYHGMA